MNTKKRLFYLFIIILIIGYFPFFKDLYVNCDGQFYLARIESIYLNLKDGIFLPNIQSGNMNGYGYLVDLFYPCIFYYLPAILRFVFPINICLYISLCVYKALFIFLTYKLSIKVFPTINKDKIIYFNLLYFSNIIFVYNILLRECYSEYIASLILPIFFIGLYDLFKNNKYKILVLGMSLLLGVHLLTLYICSFITLIVFIIDLKKNKLKHFKSLFLATIETILIGSYFLIPFIYYFKDYKYKISINLLTINTMKDCFYLILFIVFLLVLYLLKKKKNISKITIITLITIYICTPLFPESTFSFLCLLQFKSRLYIFLFLFLSILIINKLDSKKLNYVLNILIFYSIMLLFLLSTSKTNLNLLKNLSYNGYTGNYNFNSNFDENYIAIVNGEYIPKDMNLRECKENENINEYYNDIKNSLKIGNEIKIINSKNSKMIFLSEKENITINKIYYPLYKVYQEGNLNIEINNNNGYLSINNIDTNKNILLYYDNTLIQYISFCISLSCLLIIYINKIYTNKKQKKDKKYGSN